MTELIIKSILGLNLKIEVIKSNHWFLEAKNLNYISAANHSVSIDTIRAECNPLKIVENQSKGHQIAVPEFSNDIKYLHYYKCE